MQAHRLFASLSLSLLAIAVPLQVVAADATNVVLRTAAHRGGDWVVALECDFSLEADALVVRSRLLTEDAGARGPDTLPDDDRRLWSIAQIPRPSSALDKVWECTRGQPWLANALARECVEEIHGFDYSAPITADDIVAAKETIIRRRDCGTSRTPSRSASTTCSGSRSGPSRTAR